MPVVVLPYSPRPLQRVLHKEAEAKRWSAIVTHRRFGKSVWAVNHLIRATLKCQLERPRFHYIAPTFTMGKSIAWDYILHFSGPIPGHKANQAELRVDYPNNGQLRILSADNPDSMRGIYSDGAVFDEFGMHPPKVFSEVMRPALADRAGWGVFLGTPNGKNQFYDTMQHAKAHEDWFWASYKASETGLVPQAELDAARRDMTADEYAQEWECSFEAAVRGAIYAAELSKAHAERRVTTVPIESALPVDTTWDLGVGDATAIWFTQSLRSGEVRLIDYYEASGEGLPHYAKVLKGKGYLYGEHWAPHDIQVRELASGRSRLEAAQTLGINFNVVPNVPLEDGIHAARLFFESCWFDATRCKAGLEALQHYRRDYNTRLNEFKATPVHDWAEHGSSAFRYLAVRHERPRTDKKPDLSVPSAHWSAL